MSALRNAIDSLRYRWLGPPIGGPEATLRGRWVLLVGATAVVFALFFAVGRHMRGSSSSGSSAGAPLELEAASREAAVPVGLSGGSPIAGSVPVAIVAKPRPRPTTRTAAPRPLPVEVARAPSSEPPASTVAPAVEAPAPSSPSPSPAATPSGGGLSRGGGSSPSGPASSGGPSGGSGAGGGGSGAGGGGSFDTSE